MPATEPVVGFSPTDAGRIADVVRRVEKMPRNLPAKRRRHVVRGGAGPNVAFAQFRSHTDSPLYSYPLPGDANEDNVFPAFIQRSPSFIDDTTDGDFEEYQPLTYPGGYDYDAEPVMVYSLRGTYIPPDTPGGWGSPDDRLLPISKVNGKWYCDYMPRLRVYFDANYSAFSGGSIPPSSTVTYDQVSGGGKHYEGVPGEQYSPLQVSSSGVVTAYRDMDCLVTLSAWLRCSTSASSGNVYAAGTIWRTSGSTSSGVFMPYLGYFIAPSYNGSSWSYGSVSQSVTTAGIVRFDAGETLQFEIVTGSAGQTDIFSSNIFVTLTPIEKLSY